MPVVHLMPKGWLWDISNPIVEVQGDRKYAHFNHQGTLIAKSAFIELGGFDLEFKLAADTELLDRAVSSFSTSVSSLCTSAFVLGGQSGQSFKDLVLEIVRYRPDNISNSSVIRLVFKNRIRMVILNLVELKFAMVLIYVRKRQNRLLRNNEQIFFADEHGARLTNTTGAIAGGYL
jgi:hypothetical protein